MKAKQPRPHGDSTLSGLIDLIGFRVSISGSRFSHASWFTSIGSDAKLRRLSLANSSFVGSMAFILGAICYLFAGYVLKSLKELPLTFLDISGMKMGPNFNKTDDADLALLLSTSRTLQVYAVITRVLFRYFSFLRFRCTETIKEISSFIDVLKSGVAKNPNGQEWHIDLSISDFFDCYHRLLPIYC